ncbi:hypothetical protein KP509_1Z170000, partial [Ceratopteris richardii]
ACDCNSPPTKKPPHKHHGSKHGKSPPALSPPSQTPPTTPTTPSVPTPTVPTPTVPTVPTSPSPPSAGGRKTCPVDIIKLNVCSPLLGSILGNPLQSNCCALLGLIGVDIDICLCLAIDANVLGLINIHIPKLDIVAKIATSCGHTLPPDFTCPS